MAQSGGEGRVGDADAAILAGPEPFEREPRARHGVAEEVARGVRRVTARNPSPMTFTGTASYLVGGRRGAAVIDPGPDDPEHRAALLEATGGDVAAILVTHSHRDHSAGAAALAEATGAPILAFGPHGAGMTRRMAELSGGGVGGVGGGEGADTGFAPDRRLADGETVEGRGWALRAIRTPGHVSNHLAFALEGEGVLFTGDVVMAWSTTLVSPPDGDMAAFMATLARLRRRGDALLLPGHGPPSREPARLIDWQLAHRRRREAQALAALADGPADAAALAARIYRGLDPKLLPAAARNVLAHLLALEAEGRVATEGPLSADAPFRLA